MDNEDSNRRLSQFVAYIDYILKYIWLVSNMFTIAYWTAKKDQTREFRWGSLPKSMETLKECIFLFRTSHDCNFIIEHNYIDDTYSLANLFCNCFGFLLRYPTFLSTVFTSSPTNIVRLLLRNVNRSTLTKRYASLTILKVRFCTVV